MREGHLPSLNLKNSCKIKKRIVIITSIGVWRSLVARTAGGREVAGSNPVAPIEPERLRQKFTLDKEQWTC